VINARPDPSGVKGPGLKVGARRGALHRGFAIAVFDARGSLGLRPPRTARSSQSVANAVWSHLTSRPRH